MTIKKLKQAVTAHFIRKGEDTLVAKIKADEIGNIVESCLQPAGIRLEHKTDETKKVVNL